MLEGFVSRDAVGRVDLEHLHQQVHRHVDHPLFPLTPQEHLSQGGRLDEGNVLNVAIHLLQPLNHGLGSEEGTELHQLVVLIQSRFLVKQRIPPRQNAHEHDATRPDVQRGGLVNHLREHFWRAESLRARRVSEASARRIVANRATTIGPLEV